MSEDWLEDDPFADPEDPAARERAERRAEREARREEREAKKAKKEAAAPPPAPQPTPPPAPERTPEEEFWDEEPAAAPQPPAATERPAPPPPEPAAANERPAPSPPQPAAPREASTRDHEAPTGEAPTSDEPMREDPTGEAIPPEEPPPPAPVAATDEAHAEPPEPDWHWHDEGDPEMAGAARGGRRAGDDGGRRGGVLGALARHPFRIVAAILALVVLLFLNALFQPFHGDGSGRVAVVVPKGASVSEIGDLLDREGVIDNSTLFQMRVTLAGKRSEIYAGPHTLAEGMSYGAAIDALGQPPVKRTLTVTIPEGYSRSQAAQLVEEAGVPGSYTKATVKSRFLDPAQYGGKGAKDLEGFLFPNTFELKPDAPAADLVELQLKDFKRQIGKVDMRYAKSKNLTVFDVLIIASMIEDEAGVPEQRRLVASVIYNRLREGIPLGIDATIRFATGNWTEPLTESELAIDSPYNTRTNQGLPPGPINSPGLAAIDAAAHPKETDFIFYVTAPHTCGELNFSKNEAEFERDVQAYETAREEAGGQNPDTCEE